AAGRSYTTQWTKVPEGASGSSSMMAKLWVPDGGSVQARAGETSAASQVNRLGMKPPGVNELVFSSILEEGVFCPQTLAGKTNARITITSADSTVNVRCSKTSMPSWRLNLSMT